MRNTIRNGAAIFGMAATIALWFHGAEGAAPYEAIPYRGMVATALAQSRAGLTVPMSSFTTVSSKTGKTYSDTIIGGSPFAASKAATHVDVLIVPLVITIGNAVFDPTAVETCTAPDMAPTTAILQSPLFNGVIFDGNTDQAGHAARINGVDLGAATYIDAFQRAEFWANVKGTAFHIVLKPTLAPAFAISAKTVEILKGRVTKTGCAPQGFLNKTNFQNYLLNALLTTVPGIKPTSFVLFVTKNIALSNALKCPGCTRGFHSATGKTVQTFGFADYETTETYPGVVDIDTLSHEIAEWVDDPLANNATPTWGHIGQQSGCQHNWEVGDPLSGTDFPSITMANGMTYHPQELAFYSWYYDAPATPSIGAGGKFSSNGTFTQPAAACKS